MYFTMLGFVSWVLIPLGGMWVGLGSLWYQSTGVVGAFGVEEVERAPPRPRVADLVFRNLPKRHAQEHAVQHQFLHLDWFGWVDGGAEGVLGEHAKNDNAAAAASYGQCGQGG